MARDATDLEGRVGHVRFEPAEHGAVSHAAWPVSRLRRAAARGSSGGVGIPEREEAGEAGETTVGATGHRAERRRRVVALNGTGSVGKSSTAEALQGIASGPFLHAAMDALEMMPAALLSHPDDLPFETEQRDDGPVLHVRSGRCCGG